jgi:hypothetical protein
MDLWEQSFADVATHPQWTRSFQSPLWNGLQACPDGQSAEHVIADSFVVSESFEHLLLNCLVVPVQRSLLIQQQSRGFLASDMICHRIANAAIADNPRRPQV